MLRPEKSLLRSAPAPVSPLTNKLIQAYQPQCYDGPITLFCAEKSAPDDGPQRWQALTPQPMETVWVSGEHQTMLNAEHIEQLGRALAARLTDCHNKSAGERTELLSYKAISKR